MNDRHPASGPVGLFLAQPGIFEPAAIEVEKCVIGPGNPDDLGNRVGQTVEPLLAGTQRLLLEHVLGDFDLEMPLLFSSGRLARLGPQLGRSQGTAHQSDCQAEREVDAECQLGRGAMDRQRPQWIEYQGDRHQAQP